MHSIKKLAKDHWLWLLILMLSNIFLVAELFLYGKKAALLDSNAHILTIAQFYKGLKDGEFPVMWADGFANYGLPLGTIAHQLPNYLGGLLTFITQSPLISYYLLLLVAVLISSTGFYFLLIFFLSPSNAFLGSFVYSFATYRITNIYVRGAMPEIFSTIWLPYIIISLILIKRNNNNLYYPVYTALVSLLILTHPMSVILYSPAIFIFLLFLLKLDYKKWLKIILSSTLALLLASYYLLPLKLEDKYLYMAANSNMYVYNQALTLSSFLSPIPRFACSELNYIFWRCADIRFGLFEVIVGIGLIFYITISFIFKKKAFESEVLAEDKDHDSGHFMIKKTMYISSLIGAILTLFFSSSLAEFIYVSVPLIGSIQIPSRFLSVFYFFFAILVGITVESLKNRKRTEIIVWCVVIAMVVAMQFPLIYGKNYTAIPNAAFYFSQENYHGLMLQPKWTLDSREYPVARDKGEIVKGKGQILSRTLKNASRRYEVLADGEITINDHTFYFPGWNVYVDGSPVNIEFQDPAYRGVITFQVPAGKHSVEVVYEDTKIRKIGKYITTFSTLAFLTLVVVLIIRKRTQKDI